MNTFDHLINRARKQGAAVVNVSRPAALIAALLSSLSFTARAHSTLPSLLNAGAAQPAANMQERAPSQLTIQYTSQGIGPATATVVAGRVLLKVVNQRPLERVTLRLSRQNGEFVREIALPDKAAEWNTELELTVGQYVVTEASNSAGSCVITVQVPPVGQ